MYKNNAGRAVSAVGMALAISPLTACDSGHVGNPEARFADFGFPAQGYSDAGLAKPTAVEQHHFDIYTRYRAMFDAAPESQVDDMHDVSGARVLDAGMERGISDDAGPCFMRMRLMRD